MKIAAAIAVLAIGLALFRPNNSRSTVTSSATEGGYGAFRTSAGERREVRLPDGSVAKLGPMSTLTMMSQFDSLSGSIREVALEGEALFTVVHSASRPFRVHAGSTVIEDLGTEFAVRAYLGGEPLRVAVAAGSVSLRRGAVRDSAKVLQPRDVAVIPDTGEISLSRDVDVAPFTAFSTGKLVFVNAPLREVARELTRWFGVEVRVTDKSLLERHLDATFDAESLDTVLSVIGKTLNVRYDRTSQGVNFTGPGDGGSSDARTSGSASGAPTRHEAGV